jgi:hypothetical protein
VVKAADAECRSPLLDFLFRNGCIRTQKKVRDMSLQSSSESADLPAKGTLGPPFLITN